MANDPPDGMVKVAGKFNRKYREFIDLYDISDLIDQQADRAFRCAHYYAHGRHVFWTRLQLETSP